MFDLNFRGQQHPAQFDRDKSFQLSPLGRSRIEESGLSKVYIEILDSLFDAPKDIASISKDIGVAPSVVRHHLKQMINKGWVSPAGEAQIDFSQP